MRIDLRDDRPRLEIALDDGATALFSPLAADDQLLLEEGLAEMSPESIYARFGQGRGRLSPSELEYLSDVDLESHVAWGVAVDGEGAGVGRYILIEEGRCAEVAVTVLDRFQGRGLGTLLFRALAAVARADGVGEFCFEFLPDNVPVRRIVRGLDVELDESGTVMMGRISISEVPPSGLEDEFVRVVAEARAQAGG